MIQNSDLILSAKCRGGNRNKIFNGLFQFPTVATHPDFGIFFLFRLLIFNFFWILIRIIYNIFRIFNFRFNLLFENNFKSADLFPNYFMK